MKEDEKTDNNWNAFSSLLIGFDFVCVFYFFAWCRYFGGDDEVEDQNLAPQVDQNAQMYAFGQQQMQMPQGGFNFMQQPK